VTATQGDSASATSADGAAAPASPDSPSGDAAVTGAVRPAPHGTR
jgi:hypothetical protein